jgi:hypothetical protein
MSKKKSTKGLDKSILVDGKLPPEAQKVYEESFVESAKTTKEWVDELRQSRMLTADDFNIVINCRG